MSKFQKGLFDKLQKNANIDPNDVYKAAESVKNANFSDEKTVRDLVRHLSRIANKEIPKEKEDQIVQSITNNKVPTDVESMNKLFKN